MGRAGRLVTAACVLSVSLLAACGGGGGGGTTPPVGPSTNPGPSSHPSTSPSPAPSSSTTPSPGPSPTGGQTPTPLPSPTTPPPTATPPPTPSPTPVTTPTPTATGTPFAYSWKTAGLGNTNGVDDQFPTSNTDLDTKPTASPPTYDGDLMPKDPGALLAADGTPIGGGQGPLNSSVDGVPCESQMSENYHVHAFVGIYYNGQELALPDAIGIFEALSEQTDADGWPNQHVYANAKTGCFYDIHTHDASGLVHLESADASGAPVTTSLFTLGQLLDIWGIEVTGTQFGPFQGAVTVYTSGQMYRGQTSCATAAQCEVGAASYSQWIGDPHQIPLYSHEVVWIEVGSGNPSPSHLPGVLFAVSK